MPAPNRPTSLQVVPGLLPPPTSGRNDHFDQVLVPHPRFWKGYALRPRPGAPVTSPYYEKQLLAKSLGGYAATGPPYSIVYDPIVQAAVVTIPTFNPFGTVVAAIPASTPGAITYCSLSGTPNNHTTLQIDSEDLLTDLDATGYNIAAVTIVNASTIEIVLATPAAFPSGMLKEIRLPHATPPIKADVPITLVTPTIARAPVAITAMGTPVAGQDELLYTGDPHFVRLRRGQTTTTPAAHAAGASIRVSTNSITNQVNLPMGTQDGHSYLTIYDVRWTDSYLHSGLTNHKAQNFRQPGIWFEPDAAYNGGTGDAHLILDPLTEVAAFQVRSYAALGGPPVWDPAHAGYAGPNVTKVEPLSPQLQPFALTANRWVRLAMRIDQRANDYDLISTWIADELRGPFLLHNQLQLSTGGISIFNLEWNTSTDALVRGTHRDLVSQMSNVGMLIDVPIAEVPALVARPRP